MKRSDAALFQTAKDELFQLHLQHRTISSPEISWLRSLQGVNDKETAIRLLLFRAALDHGLGKNRLDALVSALWERHHLNLWELPAIREEALCATIDQLEAYSGWMLREQWVGIVWSVGHFIRMHQPLTMWLQGPLDDLLQSAADQIFWFGRTSSEKMKGRRFLFSLYLPKPWGLALPRENVDWEGWNFPVWRGSLQFWSRYRSLFVSSESRCSRIQVADYLSRFCHSLSSVDALGLGYALRWYGQGSIP